MHTRVVITSDLLRLKQRGAEWVGSTAPNIRWLYQLLRPALRSCGMELSMLAWDDRLDAPSDRYFDAPTVYDRLGLEMTPANWAGLVSSERAPDALVEELAPFVDGALVVGYELPPAILDALQRLNRPYIDVVLHPWRFMPDLVFGFRSNVHSWNTFFRAVRLERAAAERQASLVLAKSEWMAKFNMPPGTALILGQVPDDRAVVSSDGAFQSLQNHMEALHRLCVEHPLVLFKPHPYARPGCPSSKAVARLPTIKTVSHNFYHLLCQSELDTVVALNSSGLVEADVFGRRATNLVPFLYDFGGEGEGAVTPIDTRWLRPEFWQSLLADNALGAAGLLPLTDQSLRRAMNGDWGYGFIEKVCA